jgi:hypothetical protein
MCGIFGFSGKLNEKFDVSKIKILGLYNEARGTDSTGIYSPENELSKSLDKISLFIQNKEIKKDSFLLGHVRAKTIGLSTIENAHPFEYGSIIGLHNGTLKNHWELCKKYKLNAIDYNVDSQVLIKSLSKFKDPRVLYDFDGAAAVVFTDKNLNKGKSHTIFVFRNNERPLFYGETEEGIYYSSLQESLKSINCENIKSFEINNLYVIKNGKIISNILIERDLKEKKNQDSVQTTQAVTTTETSQTHTSTENTGTNHATSMTNEVFIGSFVSLIKEIKNDNNIILFKKDKFYPLLYSFEMSNYKNKEKTIFRLKNELNENSNVDNNDIDEIFYLENKSLGIALDSFEYIDDNNKIEICKEGDYVYISELNQKERKISIITENDPYCEYDVDFFKVRPVSSQEELDFHNKYPFTNLPEIFNNEGALDRNENEITILEYIDNLEIPGKIIKDFIEGVDLDLEDLKLILNSKDFIEKGYISKTDRLLIKESLENIQTMREITLEDIKKQIIE